MNRKRTTPFVFTEAEYRRQLRALVKAALAEDIGSGDRTTAALNLRGSSRARIIARQTGILAGADAGDAVLKAVNRNLKANWRCRQGGRFRRNQIVAIIQGPTASLLTAERTVLNFLSRLSGIATATRAMIDRIPTGTAQLLDTRKTTPGWRFLEKRATVLGGAQNHRIALHDALMIKDNHIIAAGGLAQAVADTTARSGRRIVICEVQNLREVKLALKHGARWLLCDNFTPPRLKKAVAVIREFEQSHKTNVTIEASGGITRRTVASIARCGVDFISTGAITHSAPAVDFSLELIA
jgi:nicotinate-nucleotide pyrophosphorylase (carboxylating)